MRGISTDPLQLVEYRKTVETLELKINLKVNYLKIPRYEENRKICLKFLYVKNLALACVMHFLF